MFKEITEEIQKIEDNIMAGYEAAINFIARPILEMLDSLEEGDTLIVEDADYYSSNEIKVISVKNHPQIDTLKYIELGIPMWEGLTYNSIMIDKRSGHPCFFFPNSDNGNRTMGLIDNLKDVRRASDKEAEVVHS